MRKQFSYFLFFLWMPLKNQRSMMKKTVKDRFFTFFINFPSLDKCFLNISSHELNRDFQHHSTGLEIWKNRKSRKNCFSNFRRTAVAKTMFFKFFSCFFFTFQPCRVLNFSVLVWWPLLISFHVCARTDSRFSDSGFSHVNQLKNISNNYYITDKS